MVEIDLSSNLKAVERNKLLKSFIPNRIESDLYIELLNREQVETYENETKFRVELKQRGYKIPLKVFSLESEKEKLRNLIRSSLKF